MSDTDTGTLLSAGAILAQTELVRERVECPEWGGHVYMRALTGDERDDWEASILAEPDKKGNRKVIMKGARARLCALATCDAGGAPLYTMQDAPQLGRLNAQALARCFDVGTRLSGLTEDDMEELMGNLGDTPAPEAGSE